MGRTTEDAYRGRYPELRGRAGVWREIARWLSARVGPVEHLVELGPGYGDFINAYPAARKSAVDVNAAMERHFASEVRFHHAELPGGWPFAEESIDLVFASNFLEHLERPAVREVLERAWAGLRPGGRIALLQPNFRLSARHYFEDPTHVSVWSDGELAQLLLEVGFEIAQIEPGLLPLTMNSRIPKHPYLVRAYLSLPWRPRAAQMLLIGSKRTEGAR